ncbi:M23 family metallopeptidase [Paenibacillus pini]|nr:M23 family metallopeptidase [Paenibacillus pini]
MKSAIKQRREERIRDLLERESMGQLRHSIPEDTPQLWTKERLIEPNVAEPDPEKIWKQERVNGKGIYHRSNHFISGFMWRLLFSSLLFVSIWGVFRMNQPWSLQVQQYVMQSLNHEMDFKAAEAWYESHLGKAPSFIPIFKQTPSSPLKVNTSASTISPIQGKIVQSFAVNLKGVEIEPDQVSNGALQVKSVETGRVLDITGNSDTGLSVTIQHVNGITATYGHLGESILQKNDWVQAGDAIGKLTELSDGQTPTLFFAIKEGNRYVDPAEVISID